MTIQKWIWPVDIVLIHFWGVQIIQAEKNNNDSNKKITAKLLCRTASVHCCVAL